MTKQGNCERIKGLQELSTELNLETGLFETIMEAKEKGINIGRVIEDGIKAKERGEDAIEYMAKHKDRYQSIKE